jgi:hypothetical protein
VPIDISIIIPLYNKEKYIEEEGLVDYWDALKAEKDKP